DLLLPILEEFQVPVAVVFDPAAAEQLSKRWKGGKVIAGMDGLLELVADPSVDYVLNGLVGSIGVRPTLEAIRRGKQVGLANKESMVMAGDLINAALREHPESALVPIDSEHSAIFQCLSGRPVDEVDFVQLTASGGPFRERPADTFAAITKADALKHPTWVMGEKITIDSATLMNKGLEVIEAHQLFGVDFDRVKVVVHPSSIVHSLVQFRDGSLMAQLGCPDMCVPILYALAHPERLALETPRLDLASIGKLEFFPPDFGKFPCLRLAYEAGGRGGTAPAVLNAANEAAVDLFLREKIAFARIPALLEEVLGRASIVPLDSLETAVEADQWARQAAVEAAASSRA
ncbi:MAG TPA: 1-deoxy-D-xylulose-5-phosphate reductoisomerase, partial [Fibrobacteria bacterium]|nr:1-deoxy-D-xylulose-5-phosphate reductoisomerase [Fibrobacteria bacterium]